MPKVNPTRKAKRAVKARRHYASKEYREAREKAMAQSKGRCEARHVINRKTGERVAVLLPGETFNQGYGSYAIVRCGVTERLHFHEVVYGSDVGLIREITGCMACPQDHGYIERTRHPTRSNGR